MVMILLLAATHYLGDASETVLPSDSRLPAHLDYEADPGALRFGERRSYPWSAELRGGGVGSADSHRTKGTVGIQLGFFPIEELSLSWSVHYHKLEYLDEQVEVSTYAWEVGVLYYPIRSGTVWPYLLAGVSVNDTYLDYSGAYSQLEDESQGLFGWQVGAGVEMWKMTDGFPLSFTLEARYGWVEERGTRLGAMDDQDLDTWQVTVGVMARGQGPGTSIAFFLVLGIVAALTAGPR